MNNFTTIIEINNLGTLNDTFSDLLHTRLTLYSTGDVKGCHKSSPFNTRFGLLHDDNQIKKRLVFYCTLLTFA